MTVLGDAITGNTSEITRSLLGAVLDACDPRPRVAGALRDDPIPPGVPVHVLAFGKASVSMARGVLDACPGREITGVVLAPLELAINAGLPQSITVFPADHPLPTARNTDAARALAEHAASIPRDHACVVCVSGGGSAHLCLPRDGVTLDEIIDTTRTLNARGATIDELNAARTDLEQLKGGGLARILGAVRTIRVLAVSDVIGGDPRVIASGPMMRDDPPTHTIVLSNTDAVNAAADALGAFAPGSIERLNAITGDAHVAGRRLAESLAAPGVGAVVMGGETTVDAARADGIGGPVTETISAAAVHLVRAGDTNWSIVGFATDGIDGPTDAAGGALDSGMDLDPDRLARAVERHDTLGELDRIGAAIRTGPTGTNVNDIIALWRPQQETRA